MDELTELMTRAEGALQARVYFFHPKDTSVEWARTTLWKRAAAIPGVEVVADANGDAARRFGAVTSGQALLYSAEGRLLFSGGLTNSRGHSGESAGRLAVLSVLASRRPGVDSTPVFGCPIIRAGGSAKGILTP